MLGTGLYYMPPVRACFLGNLVLPSLAFYYAYPSFHPVSQTACCNAPALDGSLEEGCEFGITE